MPAQVLAIELLVLLLEWPGQPPRSTPVAVASIGPRPLIPAAAQIVVQIVIGSLSCVLVFLLGRDTFSRRVGVLAGLAAATYWVFLYFEAELLNVVLAIFFDLLLLWLLIRTQDRPGAWRWVLCGGLLGLSAITVPNILLFLPFVLLWLAVLHRSRWRRALGYGACFLLGCALPIVPVTIRNFVVGGDVVLISSSAGVNFYIGNNPQSDGISAIVPGTPAEWWPGYDAQIERAEKAAGGKLKASEVSHYYWQEAFKFMREQPGTAAALLLNKLGLFWSCWEISNNQDIRFVTDHFTPVVKALPLSFWCVGPLGLLGLILALKQFRQLFPLWGFVLIYMVSVVIFFVTARYRLPVIPVLMVLGSHAVFWLMEARRAGRWRQVGPAAAVLAAGGLLLWRVPPGVEAGIARSYGSAGIILAAQGRLPEAEKYLAEAVQRYEAQPKIWFSLGMVKMQQGDFLRAEDALRRTLVFDPGHPEVHKHLGFVLAQQGKLDGALEQFTQALVSSPDDAKLHANLGGVYIQQGRMNEGVQALRRGLQLALDTARRAEQLAMQQGKPQLASGIRIRLQAYAQEKGAGPRPAPGPGGGP